MSPLSSCALGSNDPKPNLGKNRRTKRKKERRRGDFRGGRSIRSDPAVGGSPEKQLGFESGVTKIGGGKVEQKRIKRGGGRRQDAPFFCPCHCMRQAAKPTRSQGKKVGGGRRGQPARRERLEEKMRTCMEDDDFK